MLNFFLELENGQHTSESNKHKMTTNVRALSQFVLNIFLLFPSELAWSEVIK
jgi:hypothetical protein